MERGAGFGGDGAGAGTVTRGKRLVVLVGSRRALEMAVRNNDDGSRWSGLCERLRDLVRQDGVHPRGPEDAEQDSDSSA